MIGQLVAVVVFAAITVVLVRELLGTFEHESGPDDHRRASDALRRASERSLTERNESGQVVRIHTPRRTHDTPPRVSR